MHGNGVIGETARQQKPEGAVFSTLPDEKLRHDLPGLLFCYRTGYSEDPGGALKSFPIPIPLKGPAVIGPEIIKESVSPENSQVIKVKTGRSHVAYFSI